MVKTYILDTNILMRSPESLEGFADNEVVITGTTLEELDNNKTAPGEKGWSARAAIRAIDAFREKKGSYRDGYPTSGGGKFRIELDNIKTELPQGWDPSRPDNRIISTALTLKNADRKKPTILVTNDTSMKIKALSVGMPTEGYLNESVMEEYSGRRVIDIDWQVLEPIFKDGEIDGSFIENPVENEYFILKAGNESALAKFSKGNLIRLNDYSKNSVYAVRPRNAAQTFLMDALMAPVEEVPLVVVKGPAGTGKTYIALACGLEQSYGDSTYEGCIITRSQAIPDGEDFGFLPGDLNEKMGPLLSPFWDNLRTLIRMGEKKEDPGQIEMQLRDMEEQGVINITSMGYIRGRSIPNKYIILDEAQNTTPNQLKTLISRAGEGTKIVILGDPNQIDTQKLTKHSNGLVYVSEKWKGSPLCAQITFNEDECIRSALAAESISRMQ